MGFELNKLMKQYGVGTASMANYAGEAAPRVPTAPSGSRPTGDDDAAKAAQAAYDKAQTDYDAYVKDPSAFNEAMRKYQLDQKSYNQYKDAFQGRLQNTPMYQDAQYQTGPSVGMQNATRAGGIGAEKYNQNIKDWFQQYPKATPQDVRAAMDKYGISAYDVAQTRGGSMWGDAVKGPTYGAVPLSVGQMTPEQKAQYYLEQRGIGYTDADLRGATTKTFGKPNEADWTSLLNLAYPQYADPVKAAYANIGRYGGFGSNVTDVDNPGYNYWMNQLSTGAVKPGDINQAVYNAANTWMPNLSYDASKLPQGFDWGYYVNKYPDLLKSGIDTQFEAARHYYNYGQNEGRSPYEGFKPTVTIPTNPTGPSIFGNTGVNTMAGGTTGGNTVAGGTTVTGGTTVNRDLNGDGYVDYPVYGGGGFDRDNVFVQPYAKGGEVKNLADKYKVKTHYQTGGRTALGYDSPEAEADWQAHWASQQSPVQTFAIPNESGAVGGPIEPVAPLTVDTAGSVLQQAAGNKTITRADAARVRESLGPNGQQEFQNWLKQNNITVEGGAPQVNVALNTAAAADTSAAKTTTPPADAREAGLQALLAKYGPGESVYAPELKAARERATRESDAFAKLLQNALANPEDAQSSKAEMYFRLAAAFGSPTRTGQFTENLALAGKEMGEYAKGKRESNREKLALQIKAQDLRMGAAKEELSTLRALSAEEMKDRRAMATQMIKEYIESGKPQSAAGKQALDEGLTPGTPEFQKRVAAISEMKIDQQMAQINSLLGNLGVAQANLALRQQQAGKLSPAEVQMKRDTEDSLSAINSAMRDISEAYRLNPSTFDTSAVDTAKRKALELAGSKDPKLVATRTLENLLKSEMITSAAEKMKGVLSDSDIKLLQSIQGLDAKSVEERGNILRNAYARLKSAQTRQQRRLEDIGSGMYGRVSGE